jgi:hypothetical protein
MNVIKRLFAILGLFLAGLTVGGTAFGQESHREADVHRIFVGSFGSNLDAAYLRSKLLLKLGRARTILLVEDPNTADVLLNGAAAMRLVDYYNSNPRVRYRNSASVRVYDAKMTVELEDKQGRVLWSGKLKPRFWGSQYVSDNVVNQAARHVADVLHDIK